MRTLILKSDRDSFEKYYLKRMNGKDAAALPYYRPLNEFFRYLSVLHMQKLKLPGSSFWYGPWKRQIHTFDNVILFDRNYNWNIIRYIRKKNPECRIIVWYWNPLAQSVRVPGRYRKYCEEWSFNIADCKQYGLNYNVQFTFWDSIKTWNSKTEYDAYFVGRDKGRSTLLLQIKELLEAIGKKVCYIIIKDCTSKKEKSFYSAPVSYEENLRNVSNSRCIIEIAQKGQTGLTVRCLEALFNGKKIITNNWELSSYDFYDPSVIYVLQENKISQQDIREFLNNKAVPITPQILKKYDYKAWLYNFNLQIK